MDRETMTTYGLLTLTTVLMALLIGLSTPLGNKIMDFTSTQVQTMINNTSILNASSVEETHGTLVIHYRLKNSTVDLHTYKATLRKGESCKIPTYFMKGYEQKLLLDVDMHGNPILGEVETSIVLDKNFTEKYVIMVPDTYTITYYLNGGTIDNNSKLISTYTYGTKQMLTSDVEKEGYRFVGWYIDSGLGGNRIEEIPEGYLGDIVLYAKYSKI